MKDYKVYKNKKDLIINLIDKNDLILDVGFWGQGVKITDNNWPHKLILDYADNVYGVDIDFDEKQIKNKNKYKRASAEDFDFDFDFDIIFAGDLIEHLSNCGLFLDSCKNNLSKEGKLILTTPNCFGLFNLAEKITKNEPTVNSDHTCYFNSKTIKVLLEKNGFNNVEFKYLYSLGIDYEESFKKKFLNIVYYLLSRFTNKYIETLVVIAKHHK